MAIFHDIQWEFCIFFNFLSICHVIQWEFYIFLSFHQFSMLFNGIHAFFCFFVNFPCYSMGNLHFDNFPCYSMGVGGLRNLGGGPDRRTDGQTYVMVHPCVLQDIGPLGPLPKKQSGLGEWMDGLVNRPTILHHHHFQPTCTGLG